MHELIVQQYLKLDKKTRKNYRFLQISEFRPLKNES